MKADNLIYLRRLIMDVAQRRLIPDAEVYTDELAAFRRFVDTGHAHSVLETEGGRSATEVPGARLVNIVLPNVKRALDGVCRACKQKRYARRYVGKAAYHFNRRFRLREMLSPLTRVRWCSAPLARSHSCASRPTIFLVIAIP